MLNGNNNNNNNNKHEYTPTSSTSSSNNNNNSNGHQSNTKILHDENINNQEELLPYGWEKIEDPEYGTFYIE
jgi:hypothetical protein